MPDQRVDWLAGGDRRALAVTRIESAATALFLEHGIDRVSVDDVAARAGCSRATLYRHVGGKPELIRLVMTRAAATVADRVAATVAPLEGSRRGVEAILATLTAIRSDPTLSQWLGSARARTTGEYLATAPELRGIATTLTGIAPDDEAAQWIMRTVLSLLIWPLPDAAAERHLVERFTASVFVRG
ncbi:TetR/AcrR family transcriptional regulator [Nocardia sp. 2]|uniref:TetR/AcrR family transcriptional regulator n=1 Tax=Nocardia acididurans TaxID=2802282 RepID=A0ABS1M3V5_9NOCA|nr:TetR/AcrR family transcriptional regulator [Nocardia acididurans]MBL1075347.1 TetR/AcrR family transcriptional regulator [Nocardia acididurans]